MIELPDDVANALLRAVAAYLRDTAATEVPARVRRYRTFRPQGLGRHRDDILSLLDEAPTRARILDWIDKGKPSSSRRDLDLLRVACERKQGWEGELKARSQPRKKTSERHPARRDAAEQLATERDKTRRAKDDARRAREDARAESAAARKEIARLTKEVSELKHRATEAERDASATHRDLEKASGRFERELRKARSLVERAEKAKGEARRQLQDVRREGSALRREIAHLKSRLSTTERKLASTSARSPQRSKPRSVLPVPKGRLEDAPETLEHWLGSGAHLVIDGYNAAKSERGFGSLSLEKQRDRLIQEVNRLARRDGGRTIIVFDGSKVPPGIARRSRGPVEVEYSRPGEIADDHIVARLKDLPPEPVVLVTNDRELQRRARRLGATVATSDQLLALIR